MQTYYKLLIVLIFSFTFNYSSSQTGPGGVGTNDGTSDLVMWYRTDNGITTSGLNISNWENSAGYTEHNMTQNGTTNPQLISASLNGYDEIQFDTDGILQTGMNLSTTNFITNQASSFVFLKVNSITNSRPFGTLPKGTIQRFASHIPWGDNNVYFDIGACCGNNARIQVGGLTGFTNYSLWSYDANNTNRQLYRNSQLIQNKANSSTYTAHASQWFALGQDFDGNMTEFILFKTKINTAQKLIIENYISAKYNTTLSANNLYIQDNIGNGNFDHNVAGIGQASDGSNHNDSQGTGIVRINTPSNLDDGEFLFWGENIIDTDLTKYEFTTNTTQYYEHLNTNWRVSEIGDVGTVNLEFDLTNLTLTGWQGNTCTPIQLVVDNDSNFSSPTIYNLSVSGATATVSAVNLTDGDYFTIRYLDQIVWDGANYYNGSGLSNEPTTADSCLKFTINTNVTTTPATINSNIHVREVEVETGATLNVNDGFLLEVEENVVIDGTIDLLGEAQLIQNHNNITTNSGSGELIKRQEGTTNLFNYNYWSSPVNIGGTWQIDNLEDNNGVINFTNNPNANPATSPITLSRIWLYEFNGTSNNYWDWSALTTSSSISPGIGYTMKGSGAATAEQSYIFKGIPNDGNYSHAVTNGNDFLIGNPYPSALDANQFITDNLGVIDGTLYFWEHFTSNNSHYLRDYEGGYATYNLMMSMAGATAFPDASGLTSGLGSSSKNAPTSNIPVGQGFFVTINNTGNLVFNNEQRTFARETLNESVFYKNANNKTAKKVIEEDNRQKIWFALLEPNNNIKSSIGLGYDANNATTGYDNGYDARTYEDKRNDIYWSFNDEKLIIQALPQLNSNDEIPLQIKITDNGVYQFAIDNMVNIDNDINIYLKDSNTNTLYDLKAAPVDLMLENNTYENQFFIVFQENNTLTTKNITLDNITTQYSEVNKTLTLGNIDYNTIDYITFYNTIGQKVIDLNTFNSNTIDVSNFNDGIYIIKIKTNNSSNIISEKFVKY